MRRDQFDETRAPTGYSILLTRLVQMKPLDGSTVSA